jgi:phage FluMu protein gp41
MTLPARWKRSTAAERRQQRAEFAALKLVIVNSPEALAARTRKRGDDQRSKALRKMRAALAGKAKAPFTVPQLSRLRPEDLAKLRAYSAGRYSRLDAEQRAGLSRNLYLLLSVIPTEVYEFVASMEPDQR